MIIILELVPSCLSALLSLITGCGIVIAESDKVVSCFFCTYSAFVKALILCLGEFILDICHALPFYASFIAFCVHPVTKCKAHVSVLVGLFCANTLANEHIGLLLSLPIDTCQADVSLIFIFKTLHILLIECFIDEFFAISLKILVPTIRLSRHSESWRRL